MTQAQAKKIRVGDRVTVRAGHVNCGIAISATISAIDRPGREFGVKLDRRRFATVFNTEIEAQ
jgi:hypothetical protein